MWKVYWETGNEYETQGDDGKALEMHLMALDVSKKSNLPGFNVRKSLMKSAELFGRLGKFADAEKLSIEAIRSADGELGANHQETFLSVFRLARIYEQQKKELQALATYKVAYSAMTSLPPHFDKTITDEVDHYASLLGSAGKAKEAEEVKGWLKTVIR